MILNSIGTRLRLTYILLAITPLIIVGLVLTGLSYSVQREQALLIQRELAQRVGAQVIGFIGNLETELLVVGQTANVADLSLTEQERLLARLRANQSAFVDLFLLDSMGTERVHQSYLQISDEVPAINWLNSEAFQQPATTQQTYFSPVNTTDTNEPQITIAIPLVDKRTAETEAVLVANIRFKEIWDLIASIAVDEGESVYILNADGAVIAHRNPSIVLVGTTFPLQESDGIGDGLDVETAVIATDSLSFGEQELIIVAEKSVSQALALAINTVWVILGVIVVSLLLALGLSLFGTQQIVRPIQTLANLAAAIRQGDLTQRAKRGGLIELDDLAFTFNQMSGQLQETLQGLEQMVEERTVALKNSAEVSRYLSTILEQDQLLSQVVARLQTDFGFVHSTVYLFDDTNELYLATQTKNGWSQGQNDRQGEVNELGKSVALSAANQNKLQIASSSNLPIGSSLFTQLAVPIVRGQTVIGVLNAFKQDENPITQQDVDLVQSIANQLGVALQNAQSFAQLVDEKFKEERRKEEAEHQLEAYRNSPLGRAEQMALQLLEDNARSFLTLHKFAHEAGQNSDAATVLENLPQALTTLADGFSELNRKPLLILQNIAEGFHFLLAGNETFELLPVGLRAITTNLAEKEAADWEEAAAAHTIYQWCFDALMINSMEQIATLSFSLLSENHAASSVKLVQALMNLQTVQKTGSVYLRVQEARDKIAYLVTAVEQLRRIERSSRNSIGNLDRAILERITEQWLTVTTSAMSNLQTQARISCELITRHTWHHDTISLTISIRNNGRGVALNIRIQSINSEEYSILDGAKQVRQLAPGEEKQLTLRLRPRLENNLSQFRVLFTIHYVDSRGTDQIEHFADIVHLMKADGEFQYISNPYIVGTPLNADSALFFGRDALVERIKENLSATHRHNLVLIGQRRMGKTSLLKQMQTRLNETIIPVYLDGQVMALDPGMAGFFLNIATEIAFALEDHGIEIELPQLIDFEKSPAIQFERDFLKSAMQQIDGCHLLMLFDEFEELETAVRRGNLDQSVFSFLRHLMQHYDNLSFIFCGTHRLEELAADYWNVLFNISLYHHVDSLSQEEAYQLIQEPVAPSNMRYDDLSLEKMWRLTSGHPYFLQLLCHSLVNRHNRLERTYMTIADVNAALDEILASGEAHFIYLWNESTPNEKLTLFALGRIMPLTDRIAPIQLSDFWTERGKPVKTSQIRQALHRLKLREILTAEEAFEVEGEVYYRWQLGLIGLWVEKYKSSGRVWDEVQK